MTTDNEALQTRLIALILRAESRREGAVDVDALRAALSASPQAPAAQPVEPHFGIIDPDYARIYTQARIIAWQYGFACLAHGSFTRDLDLLLVPWADAAQADDVDYFAPRIAEAAGLKVSAHPASDRPHGRKTWTLLLPGFAEPRWVDLSVMAPVTPPAQPQQAEADARRALTAVVDAWEALPGGQSYRPSDIERWLEKDMTPAINAARKLLGRKKPKPPCAACSGSGWIEDNQCRVCRGKG